MPRGKLKVELLIRALDKSFALTGFSGRPMCAKCAEGASRSLETAVGAVDSDPLD
jgi:hypothetical protein